MSVTVVLTSWLSFSSARRLVVAHWQDAFGTSHARVKTETQAEAEQEAETETEN